jgi:hypothetical protein
MFECDFKCNSDCTTNNIAAAWTPLVQWLRANQRQALNTETGGGNTASCVQFMCQQIAFQAQNSDGKPFVSAHNPILNFLFLSLQ